MPPTARPSGPSPQAHPVSVAVNRLRRSASKPTAIVLGAGASKSFGYPLTSELLPQIVEWLRHVSFLAALPGDPAGIGQANRDLLRSYLVQLLPGKSLRRNNLPLVTSLLSLLDFSVATGQSVMPGRSMEETRRARALLERGILEAIADEEPFQPAEEDALDQFCGVLTELKASLRGTPLTLITTNYDLSADIAAYKCAAISWRRGYWDETEIASRIDFGFRWMHPETVAPTHFDRPRDPDITVLKLHGSTNWLRCPLCDNTYLNPWGPIWRQAYKVAADSLNTCHCSFTRLQTQIISPSYVREMREPNLHGVWKSALDGLRDAKRWLIVGYSFPDEDLAVRALFTRAYASRQQRPEIVVVQNTAASLHRYEAFFGNEDLIYCEGGLGSFLKVWHQAAPPVRRRRPGARKAKPRKLK